MEGVETIFSRPTRAIEESTRAVSSVALDNKELTQAHRYVLFNSENIQQFREMDKSLMEGELRRGHRRISNDTIHKHHMEKFCGWFRCHVMSMTDADRESTGLTDTLIMLSKGPYTLVNRLKHYVINGDDLCWSQDDVEGMTIDASIIGPRDLHEMDNFDECDFIDDESNNEDDNEVKYSCLRSDARMGRKRQLCLVYVGEGSSYARQRVEAANEEAHISEDARPMASDDETQAPGNPNEAWLLIFSKATCSTLVQNPESVQIPEPVQYPPPGNRPGIRGKTRLADIWAMTGEYKINLPLNAEGQPIEEDGSLFVRFLGSFCENGMLCPLTPAEWPKVPKKVKEDCWVEIEVV
nr:hypothetical protein CFP56_74746 [Quercus suber]